MVHFKAKIPLFSCFRTVIITLLVLLKAPFYFGTDSPTTTPTFAPSFTPFPTFSPSTQTPSVIPTAEPTFTPTTMPTDPTPQPSSQPSSNPSCQPTSQPTQPTSQPSSQPSSEPTQPSSTPTSVPTFSPTFTALVLEFECHIVFSPTYGYNTLTLVEQEQLVNLSTLTMQINSTYATWLSNRTDLFAGNRFHNNNSFLISMDLDTTPEVLDYDSYTDMYDILTGRLKTSISDGTYLGQWKQVVSGNSAFKSDTNMQLFLVGPRFLYPPTWAPTPNPTSRKTHRLPDEIMWPTILGAMIVAVVLSSMVYSYIIYMRKDPDEQHWIDDMFKYTGLSSSTNRNHPHGSNSDGAGAGSSTNTTTTAAAKSNTYWGGHANATDYAAGMASGIGVNNTGTGTSKRNNTSSSKKKFTEITLPEELNHGAPPPLIKLTKYEFKHEYAPATSAKKKDIISVVVESQTV
mmetsp:Transcript_23689/g.39612  ORF Transcript_23689/g.39612 Transcript_23689/m.39612 type:complete len:459 (-) Transcript_23689:984-2360(-)